MISFTILICSFCSEVALAYVISAFHRKNNHLDSYVNSMFLHGSSQKCTTDCTVLSLKKKYLKGKKRENKTEKALKALPILCLASEAWTQTTALQCKAPRWEPFGQSGVTNFCCNTEVCSNDQFGKGSLWSSPSFVKQIKWSHSTPPPCLSLCTEPCPQGVYEQCLKGSNMHSWSDQQLISI